MKINKLINSVFINNSINSIKDLKSYQKVRIDFYYRVKEFFKRIDIIIDSIKIICKWDIYLNKMDSLFDQIEIIWDVFYNNQILNETYL